ncbi:MAG: hypothetical protein U0736_07000 [Gemmataceae bacterium]
MNRYHWAQRGDINAFFGLMLDNVAVMIILFTAVSSVEPVSSWRGATRLISVRADAHDPGTALKC